MLKWLFKLFKQEKPPVVDYIIVDRSELTSKLIQPNDVNYKFPDPIQFKPKAVKYKSKAKRKKK